MKVGHAFDWPRPEMFLVIEAPVSRLVICSTNSPEEICFVMFPSWSKNVVMYSLFSVVVPPMANAHADATGRAGK